MAIDRQLVIDCFLAETDEALAEVEQAFLAFERGTQQPEALQATFRHLHTLKGNASSLGFASLSTYVHQVEDAFEPLRQSDVVSPETASAALAVVDELRVAVRASVSGNPIDRQSMQSLNRLRASTGAPIDQSRGNSTAGNEMAKPQRHSQLATLRVAVEKLDRMLDLVGEIGIANARLKVGLSKDSADDQAVLAFEEIERLYLQLQEHIMEARMVPVGPTFRRFVRTVRDTASHLGKAVDLVLEGEDVGVDTAVVEAIRDPLMHILRNAVDHGIEAPEARRGTGKPERGRIVLKAAHEAGTILIQVIDDGAGLNKASIQARAVRLGLISEGDRLTTAAAAELVLRPGFSTASNVTETSGRGVGMDVVRRNVQALHGHLEITSEEGRGTTVSLRLPLTLAVLDSFMVRVGSDIFLLPLDGILECVEAKQVAEVDCTALLDIHGEMVPAINLARLFAYPRTELKTAVLVRHNGANAALLVDELLGSYQAVIKPLGKMFRRVSGVSGSTILGDGRVALVLDLPSLFREAVGTKTTAAVS